MYGCYINVYFYNELGSKQQQSIKLVRVHLSLYTIHEQVIGVIGLA